MIIPYIARSILLYVPRFVDPIERKTKTLHVCTAITTIPFMALFALQITLEEADFLPQKSWQQAEEVQDLQLPIEVLFPSLRGRTCMD